LAFVFARLAGDGAVKNRRIKMREIPIFSGLLAELPRTSRLFWGR
jgi:hypothetical protein